MTKRSEPIRLFVKQLLFPGTDFGTRARRKCVRYFRVGKIKTLDAGCGNGAFSLYAYHRGNDVLGINIDPDQVRRCEEYAAYTGADASRIRFLAWNIYELPRLGQHFDQIICFETLEHLMRDREVVQIFRDALNPGGLLHLCVPNRECPFSWQGGISKLEDGGHVRAGYTHEELEVLARAAGLNPVHRDVVGGYGRILATSIQRRLWYHVWRGLPTTVGEIGMIGEFFILQLLTLLDYVVPYPAWSVYVCAQKPTI